MLKIYFCLATSLIDTYTLPYLDPVRLLPSSLTRHLTKHTKRTLTPHVRISTSQLQPPKTLTRSCSKFSSRPRPCFCTRSHHVWQRACANASVSSHRNITQVLCCGGQSAIWAETVSLDPRRKWIDGWISMNKASDVI